MAPLALLGVLIAFLVVAWFYFARSSQQERSAITSGQHLSFGPEEKAYAASIRVQNIEMKRAENFIHQEVTTLSAEAVNAGNRSLAGLEVTIEFYDDANQIAMREMHSVIEVGAPPISQGERRTFEVSFEHIPVSWNRQQPIVGVTGMQFIPKK